jgi:phosphoglycerate dehydrogenase-like enzyme
MALSRLSRRNFIATVAASGAATVTALGPVPTFANNIKTDLPADRQINIISTDDLTSEEQQKIKSVSKNINLKVIEDENSPAFADAEVIFGDVNAAMLEKAKKLKWVQVFHAGVENMPKEMINHPVVLTNMQKVFAPVIAESAIALLLSLT